MKSDFGFIIHPVDIGLVGPAFQERKVLGKRAELINKLFELMPSFKCSHVTGVQSIEGKSIEGDLIYTPYLPHQIATLSQEVVIKRVIEAGHVAKRLGCKIIGLGAYTAFVGRRGVLVQEALDMPVTTGSAYTVGAALIAAFEVADKVFSQERLSVAILGATGCLGSVIARMIAPRTEELTLIARNTGKLATLQDELRLLHPRLRISYHDSILEGIKNANLIFVSTNSPGTLIDVKDLRPGTIICDISQPRNIAQTAALSRKDIMVVDGGLIKPPGDDVRLNFYFGLPEGLAFACMAETMILALEGRYESFSLGGNITAEKVRQIVDWGTKHGFKVAEPRSFGRSITNQEIDQLKSFVSDDVYI